ncbi:MAG: hypothetical protein MK210_00645 [Dehalococcoidia bacterium]|nr:hypothetical protein [Dehalococcoidia bacterium]
MSGKKVTNLVIMAVSAFALILAIQGVLGVLDKFKSDEPAEQGVPSTIIPLLPAYGQDLPQDLTQEDIEKISSALGGETIAGLQEQLGQGISDQELQKTLKQAEALACSFQGGSWDFVREICN